MPDTLEQLRSVVSEGLGSPPAVEQVRIRARALRRRRRWPALTLVAASIVAVGSVAVAHALGSAPPARRALPVAIPPGYVVHRHLPTVVDTSLTPPGWTAVAWGDAQISVPSSWTVQTIPCEMSKDSVLLGLGSTAFFGCPERRLTPSPAVAILPSAGRVQSASRHATINGIAVSEDAQGPTHEFFAPALRVVVTVTGSQSFADRVIHTLTHSPRSVVLQPGPRTRVGAGWERVTFEGLSLLVPRADGAPLRTKGYGSFGCILLASLGSQVILSTDKQFVGGVSCPYIPDTASLVFRQGSGLQINSDPARGEPGLAGGAVGHCLSIHGLEACPYGSPKTDIVSFRVSGATLRHPLLVSIGLSGNGLTARAILDSMRPAS